MYLKHITQIKKSYLPDLKKEVPPLLEDVHDVGLLGGALYVVEEEPSGEAVPRHAGEQEDVGEPLPRQGPDSAVEPY